MVQSFQTSGLTATLNAVMSAAGKTGKDGLEVIGPDDTPGDSKYVVVIPDRLLSWLLDLRLLRHVPLAYLIPDPELLPPESIRFFHVDRTWTDRLVDGAMLAGNIGTVDMTFTAATLTLTRKLLDERLGLGPTTPISGMLIRSELVERWPDLIIEALPGKNMLIRQDVLSRSIMIALFAGVPTEVHVREPHVGLRFGVELGEGSYEFNLHDVRGVDQKKSRPIHLFAKRVLNLDDTRNGKKSLKDSLMNGHPDDKTRSRDVAINLRQQPYSAVFKNVNGVPAGSKLPDRSSRIRVRGKEHSVVSILGAHKRRMLQGGE